MKRLLLSFALALLAMGAHAQPAGGDTRLFAVEVKVGPKWDAARPPGEQAFFREHSAHLRQLREAGHILVGARYADKGLLVVSAPSADAVRALMAPDPSMSHGTFVYDVHDFNVFYPGTLQARPR